MTKYKRPVNLDFPQVYYNFRARDKGNDSESKLISYRVQDVLEEDFNYAVKMLLDFYLPEEPLCRGRNFSEKPEDVKFMGKFYENLLSNRLSLGCYAEGNELIGVNIMDVKFSDVTENHEVNFQFFLQHKCNSLAHNCILACA
jgi:hypothetical protein